MPEGAFERAVLATDRDLGVDVLPPGVVCDVDPGAFHFGRRLLGLVERHAGESVVYLSSGAAALLTVDSLRNLANALASGPALVTNNLFSSDIVAWKPAAALRRIEMPESDNALARRLRDAGLQAQTLERNAETQFDIDTPTDLAVLALADGLGPRLSAQVDRSAPALPGLQAALPLLTDRSTEVIVAGRLASDTWRYLESETACRVRVFSEERGLRAAGREESGARTILGELLQRAGPDEFFAVIAGLGQALFLDSRVLFSHMGWRPSPEDRFRSDCFDVDAITHGELRDFTRAAREAPLPVVLGGHTLVSGGLMLLTEIAWARKGRESAGA
jgi:hypothetical protein